MAAFLHRISETGRRLHGAATPQMSYHTGNRQGGKRDLR
jgi:hypothetical protein